MTSLAKGARNLSPVLIGVLAIFVAYIFLGIGDSSMKKAMLAEDMILVAFLTNVVSFFCILALAPLFGGYRVLIKTQNLKLHFLRAFLFLGVYLNFLYAVSHMSIAQTYTLCMTQPFILIMLAHFLTQEKIGLHRLISLVLGFTGVLIVLRPGYIPVELAAICAITSAFFFACGNLTIKFMSNKDSWLCYVFYIMIIQTPLLGLYLLFTQDMPDFIPSAESVPWITLGGIIYVFGLGLFPVAMHRIDAAIFGAMEYSGIIWGTLFGFLLFSEVPDVWTIAGAGVIVSSGLYLVYREKQAGHKIKKMES